VTGAVDLGGARLANPVLIASGPFGFGGRYLELLDVSRLGAVILKGASLAAWPGRAPPRLSSVAGGLVNAIGLENPGIDAVLAGPAADLAARGARVVVNVVGRSAQEFAQVAAKASDSPHVLALELNLSCPNVPDGLRYGTDPAAAARAVARVRRASRLPLWVKLPPVPPDRVALARAAMDSGADALSLVNTLPAAAPLPGGGRLVGGLSGPALRPVALLAVAETAAALPSAPILAMGGIATAADARAFFAAGARAVAVGTALFTNPLAPLEILAELQGGAS
jgi:dihydroorotate dehydrogenase (NAD+) catalytic subunit